MPKPIHDYLCSPGLLRCRCQSMKARVPKSGYLSQYMISSVLQDFPFAKPVRKLHMQLTFRDKGCYWIRVGHCVVQTYCVQNLSFVCPVFWIASLSDLLTPLYCTFLYALVQLGQVRVRAMSNKRFIVIQCQYVFASDLSFLSQLLLTLLYFTKARLPAQFLFL